MRYKIELNKHQAHILWNVCNSAQDRGIQQIGNLIGIIKESAELSQWIQEFKEEFSELADIKLQLATIIHGEQ
jgi:hypothetical protein